MRGSRAALLALITLATLSISRADEHASLPRLQWGSIYYPEQALSRLAEGKVLVEFGVKSNGSVENITIVSSDDQTLARAVTGYLKKARFDMSDPYTASLQGSPQRLGFVFCIPPSSLEDNFGLPWPAVFVRHNRFPHTQLAHPPTADSKGPCTEEMPAPILPGR